MTDIHFYHSLTLKDGTVTPGTIPVEVAARYRLFDDLGVAGRSFIDVGCWDGGFAFLAEKAGASLVYAMDRRRTQGFDFYHQHFNSKVHHVLADLFYIPMLFEPMSFDIVWCHGVLYHISDPLQALVALFALSRQTLSLEGAWSRSDSPVLELRTHLKPADPTVVYFPSLAWVAEVAAYYGWAIRKTGEWKGNRATVILERTGSPVFEYPGSVFTPCRAL